MATVEPILRSDGRLALSDEAQLRVDLRNVSVAAAVLSVTAFAYYLHAGEILLYGDAVAHIHIARRLFDSLTPGIANLGSVWLPAPHLLTAPLLVNDWMWRSGVGGSLLSMASYVAACAGIFKLVRQFGRRSGAWVASAFFALNANVLYLQSTAMTEMLYISALIWSAAYAAQFLNGIWRLPSNESRLRMTAIKLAACLWLAMWTRYDGWFQTAATLALLTALVITGSGRVAAGYSMRRLLRTVWPALVMLALAPALWLGYNKIVFGNALEFWNGPYSARAIEAKTAKAGERHPGDGSLRVAFIFFEKCAKEDVAQGRWGAVLLGISVVGVLIALLRGRASWVVLLLWVPLLFYTLSIAYGGVPIFVPFWRPWAWYNVRYGMQLFPAVCVGLGLVVQFVSFLWGQPVRRFVVYCAILFAALLCLREWQLVPLTLQEARVNARTRMWFERALGDALLRYRGERMLMYTSEYAGVLQDAGIHERDVINESNWKIWQRALDHPAQSAEIVVAIGKDAVARAVAAHPENLQLAVVVRTPEKPEAKIYRSLAPTPGKAE